MLVYPVLEPFSESLVYIERNALNQMLQGGGFGVVYLQMSLRGCLNTNLLLSDLLPSLEGLAPVLATTGPLLGRAEGTEGGMTALSTNLSLCHT